MKTIIEKRNGNKLTAIIRAKEYFPFLQNLRISTHAIHETDFVVCKMFVFNDGLKDYYEGITTIAICRHKKDAELIYQNH